MTNEIELIILWIIHIAVTMAIIITMYIKRKYFKSARDAFFIIIFGVAIIGFMILLNLHAKGSTNLDEIKSFLLLKEFNDNYSLTRMYLFGHAILVAGIAALVLSFFKK